jgi:NAD(P)-dependent dehydrogenase (short-subunit alcohol dehydrogenase family)
MDSKLLLITGANKSIGYAIADITMHRNLPFNILLCARDATRGQDAVDALKLQHPTFANTLELGIVDISSEASVKTFTEWFKTKYSKVDILLNNAGVLTYPDDSGNTHEGITVDTFATNYFGTTNFAKHMQPLVADNGKILFMGSIAGPDAFRKCNEGLQARFLDESLTQEDFSEWARDYIEDVKKGVWKEKGYGVWEYGMSKLFLQSYLSALSRSDDIVARGVQCYCMHPG